VCNPVKEVVKCVVVGSAKAVDGQEVYTEYEIHILRRSSTSK
jgi:hypothetical protein